MTADRDIIYYSEIKIFYLVIIYVSHFLFQSMGFNQKIVEKLFDIFVLILFVTLVKKISKSRANFFHYSVFKNV